MNKIVVLAAGKGTRMKSELPKVLVELNGCPMIKYLMGSIKKSGIDENPIIIVSPDNKEIIKQTLKDYRFDTCIQETQLGTGHALSCVESSILNKNYEHIIVFYGDHPFVQSQTIKFLVNSHNHINTPIAMMTTIVEDFKEWRKACFSWGRIVRDELGIKNIIESKDATQEQLQIKEINPGFYCFKADWLWENIKNLKNNNKQKEYYLTDLIFLATKQGYKIHDIPVDTWETIGINSLEELALAEELFKSRIKKI